MKIHSKRLVLAATFAIAASCMAESNATVPFVDVSKLSTGKWVKIRTGESGIYEISYSKLKEMGFSDPSKVAVYGTGDSMRPDNFTDANGNRLYADDLPALSTFHFGDKLYFYGRGPGKISFRTNRANETTPYFSRDSRNIYSANGYYFLSEGRDDAKYVDVAESYDSEAGKEFSLFDYIYHEKDIYQNYNNSGQLFFGESFKDASSRSMNIPYSLPLADVGTPVSMECVFMHNNSTAGSTLTYGVGTAASAKVSATIANIASGTYYTYQTASPSSGMVTLPGKEGTINITYAPKGTPSGANLDYLLVGYKKMAGYQNDEAQFRGFVGMEGLPAGTYSMTSAPSDALVWRVDKSGNLEPLAIAELEDGGVNITLDSDIEAGSMLVSFSPSREQMQPEGWEEVKNQNLHAIEQSDLVIITLPQYTEFAKQLAQLNKGYDGSDVVYACTDEIYNEFSEGIPDPMAYRTFVKMLYDKSGDKLKNVVLVGDQRANILQADKPMKNDAIITYQSLESNMYDNTYAVNDIHGMMNDFEPESRSGQYIYQRDMQVGVASLPVHSESDCDVILDKISRFMTDDSFAYWLNNNIYLADAGDNDVHASYSDDIATRVGSYTNDAIAANKIYANNYQSGTSAERFINMFNQGAMHTIFFGHGGINGISHFFSGTDVGKFKNKHLGFMAIAGCEAAGFDQLKRGAPEKLLLSSPNGLICGLVSSRTAWASQNKNYMNHFTTAMYLERERKKGSRTIGEIYARSKSLSTSGNEFVYHLIGYPGLRFPTPTAICAVTDINGKGVEKNNDVYTLAAGGDVTLKGEIRAIGGDVLTNYNGKLVAKIYEAPRTSPIGHIVNTSAADEPLNITYDDAFVGMTEGEVKNGRFEFSVNIPALLGETEGMPSIRLSAYNPKDKAGSTGICRFNVVENNGTSGSTKDTTAPTIERFEVNSVANTRNHVNGAPTFYAEITDDSGVRLGASELTGGTKFLLDGRIISTDLTGFCEATEGGKRVALTLPMDEINSGHHTATLEVRDYSGNSTKSTIDFTVGLPGGEIAGNLTLREVALLDNATFDFDLTEGLSEARIYVNDKSGNTVYSTPFTGGTITWNGLDFNGQRVAEGMYSAYISGKTSDGKTFVSPVKEFAAFARKK